MIGQRVCPKCGAKEEDGVVFPRERERQCRECIYKREREYKKKRPEVIKGISKRRTQKGAGKKHYASMTHEEKEIKKASQVTRYAKKRSLGNCTDCPERAVLGKSKCEEHLHKASNLQKKIMAERTENGLCTRCGNGPLKTKRHCGPCRVKINLWLTEKRKKDVELIKDHYGRACMCCGETESAFLTLDHINDDGGKQRKEFNTDTYLVIARKHRKTGVWPDDLQVLCYNCNSGRYRNGGICPHKSSKSSFLGGVNK